MQIARFIGPMIGGIIIGSFNISWALWIDGLTFIITAITAVCLPKISEHKKNSQNLLVLMKEGICYFRKNIKIKKLTIVLTIYNLGMGGLLAVIITTANQHWNWNIKLVGSILSGASLMGCLGSWITVYAFKSKCIEHRILFWLGICLIGTFFLLSPWPIFVILGYYILLFGEGGMNVTTMIYRQHIINKELTGRLNAIIRMFVMGCIPLSSLILGWMTTLSNYLFPFIPIFICTILALAIWWKWQPLEYQNNPSIKSGKEIV